LNDVPRPDVSAVSLCLVFHLYGPVDAYE